MNKVLLREYYALCEGGVCHDHLTESEKQAIQFDNDYSSTILGYWDAAYQALVKGIIKLPERHSIQTEYDKILPHDIYRFIRKYYKNIWVYITLSIRIFSGYNPLNELKSTWKTRTVKNISIYSNNFIYN